MKYLKSFLGENLESKSEDVLVIKDVFQDLIDEWDMEVIMGDEWINSDGNYIRINGDASNKGGNWREWIVVNIFNKRGGVAKMISESRDFEKDVEDHIGRLRTMGYHIEHSRTHYRYYSFYVHKKD